MDYTVSPALQAILALLVGNLATLRGVLAGTLRAQELRPDLNSLDIDALNLVIARSASRLTALASMLTERRLRQLEGLLPRTRAQLEGEFSSFWQMYLESRETSGIPRPTDEARAFANFLLRHLERGSHQAAIVRCELLRCEVAHELTRRAETLTQVAPLYAAVQVRTSPLVRIERFSEAIYRLMASGSPRVVDPCVPACLVFHPTAATGLQVSITRISEKLADILLGTPQYVPVSQLCASMSVSVEAALVALQRLVEAHILEVRHAVESV